MLAGALLLLAALAGCAPYTLQGKVIEGDITFIAIVDADDPRLEGPGLANAEVRLQTDPQRINREVVGTTISSGDGTFSIPFSEIGAGVLLYDVGLQVRRGGYQRAEQMFRLPPSDRRVLVILCPGADRGGWGDEDDPLQTYERFR
jgi:hypothetical protein